MLLALSVGKAENAAALAVYVTARSGTTGAHRCLPEGIVVDNGCFAVVSISTAEGHSPD